MGDHSQRLTPKARKRHRCFGCGAVIEVGETHVQYSGHQEGYAFRHRLHNECDDFARNEFEPGEQFFAGDIPVPERIAQARNGGGA